MTATKALDMLPCSRNCDGKRCLRCLCVALAELCEDSRTAEQVARGEIAFDPMREHDWRLILPDRPPYPDYVPLCLLALGNTGEAQIKARLTEELERTGFRPSGQCRYCSLVMAAEHLRDFREAP